MDWKADAAPRSPFVARFGPVGARLTIMIEYSDDGFLASFGTAMRDDACEWCAFLTGDRRVDLQPGLTMFKLAELGVTTIGELHEAGFTAGR